MVKIKQLATRQRIRKGLLFLSLLLFPVTLYYFSPALVLGAAAEGVVNASLMVFGLFFVSSPLLGRAWCGWLCPAGALQEFSQDINRKRTPGGRFHWTKWFIWVPWITLMAVLVIRAGGYQTVNPWFNFETGVTMTLPLDGGGPPWFMIYYIILALFVGLAIIFGRRAGCHTVCWMAPFMIIGRWIRNRVRWPSLRLQSDTEKCTSCLRCTRDCPMSLEVNDMVQAGDMEDSECILCGTCVDGCPTGAVNFTFSGGK
jgi:ferredoxin-type protein NapH